MTKEAVELKPCPFCGGDAELVTRAFTDEKANLGDAYVWCDTCSVEQPYRASRAEAITAWNTRTVPQVAEQLGDELLDSLPDDEVLSLGIIGNAWSEAGLKHPFFGEAYEPGTVIRSIVRQVTALRGSVPGRDE